MNLLREVGVTVRSYEKTYGGTPCAKQFLGLTIAGTGDRMGLLGNWRDWSEEHQMDILRAVQASYEQFYNPPPRKEDVL